MISLLKKVITFLLSSFIATCNIIERNAIAISKSVVLALVLALSISTSLIQIFVVALLSKYELLPFRAMPTYVFLFFQNSFTPVHWIRSNGQRNDVFKISQGDFCLKGKKIFWLRISVFFFKSGSVFFKQFFQIILM